MKFYKKNEKGLVALTSVIIIIIIISIITLSLAALTRRSIRQSVDEQLSTQAQYAAESGINAALAKINDPTSPLTTPVTTCDKTGSASGAIFTNNVLGDNVRYSCVLVDFSTPLIATELGKESLKVYKLTDSSGGLINSLKISWTSTVTSPNFSACDPSTGCLTSTWTNRYGLLRVRLIPFPDSGFSRTIADNGLIDIVAYPFQFTPTTLPISASASTKTWVLSGNNAGICSTTGCSIDITDLYQSGDNLRPGKYYVQLYTYYTAITNVKISGKTSTGSDVLFSDAQATIDSTGVSQDVAKRIQVKIAIEKSNQLPVYALGVGESLCKKFTTSSGIPPSDLGGACLAGF